MVERDGGVVDDEDGARQVAFQAPKDAGRRPSTHWNRTHRAVEPFALVDIHCGRVRATALLVQLDLAVAAL